MKTKHLLLNRLQLVTYITRFITAFFRIIIRSDKTLDSGMIRPKFAEVKLLSWYNCLSRMLCNGDNH